MPGTELPAFKFCYRTGFFKAGPGHDCALYFFRTDYLQNETYMFFSAYMRYLAYMLFYAYMYF